MPIYIGACCILFLIPFIFNLNIGLNFFERESLIMTLILTIVTIIRMTGFLASVIPLGVVLLLIKRKKQFIDYYLLTAFIGTLPLLKSAVYIPETLSVFYSVFIALPVFNIMQWIQSQKSQALFVSSIVIAQIALAIILQVWQPDVINPRSPVLGRTIDNKYMPLAHFINSSIHQNIISDNPTESARMSSLNYCRFIYTGYTLLGCGFITPKELRNDVVMADSLQGVLVSPLSLKSGQINYYIDWLITRRDINSKEVLELRKRYNIGYLMTNSELPYDTNRFARSAELLSNRIFDNGEQQLYDLT